MPKNNITKPIEMLKLQIKMNKLAHAYIFNGKGIVKTAAIELAKMLNCTDSKEHRPCNACDVCHRISNNNYPDLKFINIDWQNKFLQKGSSKTFSIDTARFIRKELSLKPFCGRWKIVIVEDAEKFSIDAFNSLLKIIEEPPPNSLIILLTNFLDLLPPTVTSRCQVIHFPNLEEEKLESWLAISLWERLNDRNSPLQKSFEVIDDLLYYLSREDVEELLTELLQTLKKEKIPYNKFSKCAEILLSSKNYLSKYNLNISILLDSLLVRLKDALCS